ncbi:MAG: TonB-dependent receptor plug domain-containing protein, partial [Sphingomonadaceae bacterium]|nr:TonB-dependent receptor plug domain-containing protein [Sphingomonadaceae bacterium]
MMKLRSSASIGAVAIAIASPAMAQEQATDERVGGIGEIVVTATKRSENLQDVAVAISAIGEKTLDELRVDTFDDYLEQLPNVTAGGGGPGQSTIYVRGLASTTPNLTTAGVAGLAPNVALYLDEQPLAQPGRNLDVYAADLQRIEVLAGPQGTLFGASSQAGTVRLITNKPSLSGFAAKANGGLSFTKGGEASYKGELMINVPVSENFALRGVVFHDHQGGYIDNVAGTRTAAESARFRSAGTVRANGVPVSAQRAGFQAGQDLSGVNFIAADNSGIAENNFNDTQYSGFRVSALYEFTPDWKLTVSHSRQSVESDGVFFADPELGLDGLDIERFEQDRLEDDFSNTSWTVEGRLGALELLYTGAYTDRETQQRVDYSDYLFAGQYLPYYICDGSVSYPGGAPAGTCQAPNQFVNSNSDTTVFTQELRINTPKDQRIRATLGAFYSDLTLKERNDFTYPGSQFVQGFGAGVVGFAPNYPFMTGFTSDPGPFPAGVIFRNDVKRTDKQFGIFGETSFDVLPDVLTATIGARYYDIKVDFEGSANSSFCNLSGPSGSDVNAFGTDISDLYNGDGQITVHNSCNSANHITYTQATVDASTPASVIAALNAPDKAKTSGVIFKGTLTYTPNDDYNGADSFVVTVTDAEGFTTDVTINVTVTAVDDAGDDTISTLENTPVTGSVTANDNFEGTPVYTIGAAGANGGVIV